MTGCAKAFVILFVVLLLAVAVLGTCMHFSVER